jgi:alpha-beta hydrolase superfamily lysophospholipase
VTLTVPSCGVASALAFILLCASPIVQAAELPEPVRTAFRTHYQARLGPLEERSANSRYTIRSTRLRGEGNHPNVLHHGTKTADVLVLIHGLTDSPFYMDAIGRAFHDAGVTVIFPLLDAHGLVDPDRAMEDDELAQKWRATVDHAVTVAAMLGDRISIGGFSTGGP